MKLPRRTLSETLAPAAGMTEGSLGPLSDRLAFVAHRAHLRRFVGETGGPLELVLERLEEAEQEARRRRPCLRLGER